MLEELRLSRLFFCFLSHGAELFRARMEYLLEEGNVVSVLTRISERKSFGTENRLPSCALGGLLLELMRPFTRSLDISGMKSD